MKIHSFAFMFLCLLKTAIAWKGLNLGSKVDDVSEGTIENGDGTVNNGVGDVPGNNGAVNDLTEQLKKAQIEKEALEAERVEKVLSLKEKNILKKYTKYRNKANPNDSEKFYIKKHEQEYEALYLARNPASPSGMANTKHDTGKSVIKDSLNELGDYKPKPDDPINPNQNVNNNGQNVNNKNPNANTQATAQKLPQMGATDYLDAPKGSIVDQMLQAFAKGEKKKGLGLWKGKAEKTNDAVISTKYKCHNKPVRAVLQTGMLSKGKYAGAYLAAKSNGYGLKGLFPKTHKHCQDEGENAIYEHFRAGSGTDRSFFRRLTNLEAKDYKGNQDLFPVYETDFSKNKNGQYAVTGVHYLFCGIATHPGKKIPGTNDNDNSYVPCSKT